MYEEGRGLSERPAEGTHSVCLPLLNLFSSGHTLVVGPCTEHPGPSFALAAANGGVLRSPVVPWLLIMLSSLLGEQLMTVATSVSMFPFTNRLQ